jgi:PAS domain S-box-containing protein
MNYEKFLERVHPEDRDYIHKKWSAAIKGEPYDIQHRLLIDNEVKWVREKAELIFDSKKNPIRGIGITQDITERKLFENELEESENKFRFIFENALVGIGISNSRGDILFANHTMFKMNGYASEDLPGISLSRIYVNPSDREELMKRLKTDGVVENYEVQLYKRSKEIYWANLSTVQIKQANEERILTSIIDISERKKMEMALQESELKFRTLVTHIEEIIYIIDINGIFLLSEGKGLSKLDLNPGDIVGKSVFDLYKEYPAMLNKIRQTLNGETVSFESYVGNNYFRNWYTPHKNQEDEIIGLLGLSVNATEQKNAERLLEKSHRQLQKAEKIALMGSIDWDLKTNEVIWSKELYNLYGVEQGIPITIEKTVSLVHPDDLEFVNKNLEMAIQGDKIYNIDHRIIRPDNKVIWVSARADLEYDKMGKPTTLLGIVIDITERKQAEQKIMKYKDHLKELASELTITEERLRKQIATDLHDDVGQLLASARMQLGTINNEMDKYEVPKKIESISQSLSKAIQFTRNAIFNLSPPQLSEIGLYAAIHDWMKEQIEIKYGINTLMTGDNKKFHLEENTRLLLFRSIRELLMNVVKHARAKHLNVNISTQKGILEVRIQDDGIGFDSKSDLTRLKSKGYGLFSIQERMADLGGYMKIESNPGKGTEIKLVLPLNENLS